MNRILILAIVAAPLLWMVFPPPVQAQTSDEIVDRLDAKLHLSADQKTQIQPIIADRRQQLLALRDDTTTPRLRKARKMKAIFADSDQKIEALLDEQQKQQYAQIREQMRAQLCQRLQDRQVVDP